MPGWYQANPLKRASLALTATLTLALAFASGATDAHASGSVALAVHSDRPAMLGSDTVRPTSALDPSTRISVTLTLPLTNKADLDTFVQDVSNPSSPRYGQYLTPAEFAAKYGASQAGFDAVLAWAKASGLQVTQTSLSRNAVSISATASQLGKAFGVSFNNYFDAASGSMFFSAASSPKLPGSLAKSVSGVYGLSSYAVARPMDLILTPAMRAQIKADRIAQAGISPLGASILSTLQDSAGAGHDGALSPSDLNAAYQMPAFTDPGKGQTLGCFETGGYYTGDPIKYQKYYALPATPITARLVAGYDGSPTAEIATETAIDVDMELAMAPYAHGITVYEAGAESSFLSAIIDGLTAVADDDKVNALDISYGLDEIIQVNAGGLTGLEDERTAVERLAAEGISVFASSGDDGAYGDTGKDFSPASYNVEDPASQPLVTGVGGTTLLLRGGKDVEELTWNELSDYDGGGSGGGVSDLWKLPSYQNFTDGTPLTAYNGGSPTYRNVPDVAAVADPYTGVDIYTSEAPRKTVFGPPGGWVTAGGTSVSAPIWAGFTAVVNQQRGDAGLPQVGFANPLLYSIFNAGLYFQHEQFFTYDFDDVDNGTNGNANLFGDTGYYAGLGYDNNTGLGSLTGGILMGDMTATPRGVVVGSGTPPPYPANFHFVDRTATSATLKWNPTSRATGYVLFLSGVDSFYGNVVEIAKMFRATKNTSMTVKLNPNSGYTFFLAAVNKAGSSDQVSCSFYTPPK